MTEKTDERQNDQFDYIGVQSNLQVKFIDDLDKIEKVLTN